VLLLLLCLAGAALLVTHIHRKRTAGAGLSTLLVTLGGMLVFLSISGVVLKINTGYIDKDRERRIIEQFIAEHRVKEDGHWVIVVDFTDSISDRGAGVQGAEKAKMNLFVAGIKEVLLEDIPEDFAQPSVVLVPTSQSPWQSGVNDSNFDDVLSRLRGDEVLWGVVQQDSLSGKAFLAISEQLSGQAGENLDRLAPLRDLDLNNDLRRDFQFNREGYSRLIGMVMLGMALESIDRARKAQGPERRDEFLKAGKQLAAMRKKVSGAREDAILKRTVYSSLVDDLIAESQREAEVQP
jgi:hypothetical protein